MRNAQGCVAEDSARIEVVPIRKVYIPNVFSPNHDQQNERFFIQGRDGGKITQWEIKDRWGNLVFAQKDIAINDASLGWDGTFRGKALAAGAFFYVVEILFPDGEKKKFQGELKLIR
jgi:gliding motility-associated-like protein